MAQARQRTSRKDDRVQKTPLTSTPVTPRICSSHPRPHLGYRNQWAVSCLTPATGPDDRPHHLANRDIRWRIMTHLGADLHPSRTLLGARPVFARCPARTPGCRGHGRGDQLKHPPRESDRPGSHARDAQDRDQNKHQDQRDHVTPTLTVKPASTMASARSRRAPVRVRREASGPRRML